MSIYFLHNWSIVGYNLVVFYSSLFKHAVQSIIHLDECPIYKAPYFFGEVPLNILEQKPFFYGSIGIWHLPAIMKAASDIRSACTTSASPSRRSHASCVDGCPAPLGESPRDFQRQKRGENHNVHVFSLEKLADCTGGSGKFAHQF